MTVALSKQNYRVVVFNLYSAVGVRFFDCGWV